MNGGEERRGNGMAKGICANKCNSASSSSHHLLIIVKGIADGYTLIKAKYNFII